MIDIYHDDRKTKFENFKNKDIEKIQLLLEIQRTICQMEEPWIEEREPSPVPEEDEEESEELGGVDLESNFPQIIESMDLDHLVSLIQPITDPSSLALSAVMKLIDQNSQLFSKRKTLHKGLVAYFEKRFPDLSHLISDYTQFAEAAKYFATNSDLNGFEGLQNLSQKENISLTLSLHQNLGPPIESPIFQDACNLQIRAGAISKDLSTIISAAISKFAPNLTELLGAELSALLITFAGGIQTLATSPACNIKRFGAKKSELLGYSSRSSNNHQGIIYHSPIVQESPPEFRDATFRDLANKVALVARVDSSGQRSDGSYGKEIKEKISVRLDKKLNNHTPKYVKPLPIPGENKKKARGGRQARALKKKFGMSEALKKRNKIAFGIDGQYDDMGLPLGMEAVMGYRKSTAAIDEPYQKKIEKKLADFDSKHK